jgi:hypothetical protein
MPVGYSPARIIRSEVRTMKLTILRSVEDAEFLLETVSNWEHLAGSLLFQHAVRRRYLGRRPGAAEDQNRIRSMKVGYPWLGPD